MHDDTSGTNYYQMLLERELTDPYSKGNSGLLEHPARNGFSADRMMRLSAFFDQVASSPAALK